MKLFRAVMLQEFVGGSGEAGVVYVSLGTVCSIGPQEFRELAAALSALPARVIWKVGMDDLPEGVTLPSLGLADNLKVRMHAHLVKCPVQSRLNTVSKTQSSSHLLPCLA